MNTKTTQLAKSNQVGVFLENNGLWVFTVCLCLFFGIMEPRFFRLENMMNILTTATLSGIAGIGMTLTLATGETDFSIGSYMTMSACVMTALLQNEIIENYYLAVAVGLLAAMAIGAVNAFLHVVVGIPTFVATVSTSYIAAGAAKMVIGGISVYKGNWDSKLYTYLGQHKFFGWLPVCVVVLLVISVVFFFLTEKTKTGKQLYAVGANARTCRYIGIDERKVKIFGFLVCALLCGLSGIINASMSNGAGPYLGDTYFLTTLMVVMLGANLKKGVFNVPGTIVGSFLIAMLNNGMTLLKLGVAARYVILGAVLLASVSAVALARKRVAKN